MGEIGKFLDVEFKRMKVSEYIKLLENEVVVVPPFQRRSGIWNNKKKSNFIVSQLFYFTTPLILRERNNKYYLIDGLQRTNSIITFFKDLFGLTFDLTSISDINNENLLNFIEKSNNKKFSQLDNIYKDALLNSEINFIILNDKEDSERVDDIIYIFKMINSNTMQLSKSEMRFAIYYSEGLKVINNYIKQNAEKLSNIFKLKLPHKRMKDIDIFLRMFGIYLNGEKVINVYRNYDNYLNMVAYDLFKNLTNINDIKILEDLKDFLTKIDEIFDYIHKNNLNIAVLTNKNYSFFDIIGISAYAGLNGEEVINFIGNLFKNEQFVENISERDNMKPEAFKERIKILLEELDKMEN